MLQQRPDILILFAGANDLAGNQSAQSVVDDIKRAINLARTIRPNIRIVVPQLFPHKNNQTRTDRIAAYNQILPGALQLMSTPNSLIIVPDLFSGYCAVTNPNNPPSRGAQQFANDGSHPGVGPRVHRRGARQGDE